jgi:hypothetical protein
MHISYHRNINNTLVYSKFLPTQRVNVFQIAHNADETKELVENNFESVCTTSENLILFAKRKIVSGE